ncbi:MAG: glycerol kinase GlpK [Candidatus Latescibacteria bacterium]|nr:glycerol kinase GlpK [Candidatus Latescibacterota bacterium]
MNYILALDQSTSATKAILFDEAGRPLDREVRQHQQLYPEPGWVEHDAEEIWQNVLEVLRCLLQRHSDKTDRLRCLSLTNQRETVVAFEKNSGKPLHNAIVWQCRRGDPLCRELVDSGHEEEVRRKTGLKIDTYFSASKLTWLVRNQAGIKAKLEADEALLGTIDVYLIYRLTGGQVFATDHTNACRTLLYDIDALRWDDGLCALFEVPAKALPQVRESASIFGQTDLEGTLKRPLPIAGVMGDSQASLFAQRCFEPGEIKVTFGTGSSILLNIGQRLRYTDSGAVSTLAWVYQGRATYSFEGLINYSAATISWLKDQLGLIQDSAQSEELALSVPDSGGVYLVPAFAGLSAPYWNTEARAAIIGLTAHSSKPHVVRAGLESIAYQIRDVLEMMRQDAGLELQNIQGDGGPTANRLLMQFTADLSGLELVASDIPDISPLGATLAGGLATGLYDTLEDIAALPRPVATYTPQMSHQEAESKYAGWQKAVQRVL